MTEKEWENEGVIDGHKEKNNAVVFPSNGEREEKNTEEDSPRDTNTDHYKHPNPLCWPHTITTNLYQRSDTAHLPVNGDQ